jgi:hypothetical protein
MQKQFLSHKETQMYKPSIQSIVLPSIYEHKVGESKFLDEESKQTQNQKAP